MKIAKNWATGPCSIGPKSKWPTDLQISQYLSFQFTLNHHLGVKTYTFKVKDSNRAITKFQMVSVAAIFQNGVRNMDFSISQSPIHLESSSWCLKIPI